MYACINMLVQMVQMRIRIDATSAAPLWRQIVHQVTLQILAGNVALGERLPTVRELASELRVNPNTIARAFQEMERSGIIETRRGLGTFAREAAGQPDTHARRVIEHLIDDLVTEAVRLGVSPGEVADAFAERMERLRSPAPSTNIESSAEPASEAVKA